MLEPGGRLRQITFLLRIYGEINGPSCNFEYFISGDCVSSILHRDGPIWCTGILLYNRQTSDVINLQECISVVSTETQISKIVIQSNTVWYESRITCSVHYDECSMVCLGMLVIDLV